jgi:hypothetical protein
MNSYGSLTPCNLKNVSDTDRISLVDLIPRVVAEVRDLDRVLELGVTFFQNTLGSSAAAH